MRSRRVWLFNCANTFSGNPKWLFLYVNRYRPDIEAHWICDSEATARNIRALGYRATIFGDSASHAVQRRAGVWVVNQVKEHIPAKLNGVILLNLWHGVGVKSIERAMNEGYLLERIAAKYIRNNRYYREKQLFLVTSEAMEEHFKKQIGLDEPQIVRGGYPQNVYSRELDPVRTFDHDAALHADTVTGRAGGEVLMYAPTPRRNTSTTFLQRAIPDVDRLVERLATNNQRLILKMHPHLSDDPVFVDLKRRYGSDPHLIFWDNDDDVYEVFDRIDVAIVDYSSILYDVLAAGGTRFVRYIFDIDDEGKDVLEPGVDYMAMSCGVPARSFDELLDVLGDVPPVPAAELDRLREHFWSFDDGAAVMGRLVDAALSFEVRSLELPELHSFDVFDTVIHRKAVVPRSVFDGVRERIAASEVRFPTFLEYRYTEVRMQAEATAREARRRDHELMRSGLLEIQFADIFERLRDIFDLTEEQVGLLEEWELAEELAAVIPDPEQIVAIKALRAAGHDVVLISDQYMPEEHVRRLLAAADPVLAELPLYLSSSYGVQKTTGLLFLRVYQDLEYNYARWVHHGDNQRADVDRPKSLWIDSVLVPATILDQYENEVANNVGMFDGRLLAGILRDFAREGHHTEVESFAYRVASAYLVPYVDWAVRDAAQKGYRTLYFVARDGYHMHRIAAELVKRYGLDLKVRYMYGSRSAWRVASQIDELDSDLFEPHGDFAGANTPGALLANARMTRSRFAELFPRFAGMLDLEEIPEVTRLELVEAMSQSEGFREHLLAAAVPERELAVAYLRQEIDLDEPYAFVEYWGRGYTQDCLVRLIEVAAGAPQDVPMYYARSIYPTVGRSIRHNFTGANYSMLFIEAIFANLDHGSVQTYVRRGETIEPVYQARQNNAELHHALERYLVEFATAWASADFRDRDRTAREWFRFGFDYFRRNQNSTTFTGILAPLYDAVELGRSEREFAPPLTWGDLARLARGGSFSTRSMPLSLARSGVARRWVYQNARQLHEEGRVYLLPAYFVRDGVAAAARRVARKLTGW